MTAVGVEVDAATRRALDGTLVLAVLIHQQSVLSDPAQWTRVALARTVLLEPVVPLSDRAICWSLSGALAVALREVLGPKMSHADWQRLYDLAVTALWSNLPDDHPRSRQRGRDLDGFNDYPGTGHGDVADLVDRAVLYQLSAVRAQTAAVPLT
jgi:hypothetical protein